jgi:hypothetical protein
LSSRPVFHGGSFWELQIKHHLSFYAENSLTFIPQLTSLKTEIMKYIPIFLVLGIISCNKNDNHNTPAQIVYQTGDTIELLLQNNASSDIFNVKVGYIEWDWYDDVNTKAFLLQEMDQIKKGSTSKTNVHRKHMEVWVWFDTHSQTFMAPVTVSREVGIISGISENMRLVEMVAKTSNRYPH